MGRGASGFGVHMSSPRTILELVEYHPVRLERAWLSESVAAIIWRNYHAQVALDFPSPKTQNCWQLTAQGWVGFLPVTPNLTLALQPRVPLRSLFALLEYAFALQSFHIREGLIGVDSLPEFYERLALLLAQRVLERCRKGIYRTYLSRTEHLPVLRGQWHGAASTRQPLQTHPLCTYDDYSADVAENQIIAWTLHTILRSGLCMEATAPTVQRAFRALQGLITLTPFSPDAMQLFTYQRLNADYAALHALCRFFLSHSGPGHHTGEQKMAAFMVDMARLYERFVAEWLKSHLDPRWRVQVQERFPLDDLRTLTFTIDLVLYERATGRARLVLDTKYKLPTPAPSTEDIAQVIAYAQAKGVPEAVLIYPAPLEKPLDVQIGNVRVRSAMFILDDDLERAGQAFLRALAL